MSYLEQHSDRIVCWRLDAALDFRSSLRDLQLHGLTASTQEQLPDVDGLRVALLPITRTSQALDEQEPTLSQWFTLIAETRQELEALGARIYGSKTTKKQTGQCYFRGAVDRTCNRGEEVGAFLRCVNDLTLVHVLGQDLATQFKSTSIASDADALAWLQSV